MSAIEEAFARLPSDMQKRLSLAVDITPERQELPSVAITKALGGGLGYGRIAAIYGSKSAGKSTMCLQMVGMAQKAGKTCAWFDAEKAFDSDWARRLGVDTDDLIYSSAQLSDIVGNQIVALIEAGVDLIVVDSISAIIPNSYVEKNSEELSGMERTRKVGSHAQDVKALLRSVNYVNKNTLVVFISQTTTKMYQNYTKQDKEGGNAFEFFSSQMIKLISSNSDSNLVKADHKVGNKILQIPVGRNVDWLIEYNKLGRQGGSGTYKLIFEGDDVGVDEIDELVTLGVEYGYIDKKAAWLSYQSESAGELKYNGQANFVDELKQKPEVIEELREVILGGP